MTHDLSDVISAFAEAVTKGDYALADRWAGAAMVMAMVEQEWARTRQDAELREER